MTWSFNDVRTMNPAEYILDRSHWASSAIYCQVYNGMKAGNATIRIRLRLPMKTTTKPNVTWRIWNAPCKKNVVVDNSQVHDGRTVGHWGSIQWGLHEGIARFIGRRGRGWRSEMKQRNLIRHRSEVEDPLRHVPYSTSSQAFAPPGVIVVWGVRNTISLCNIAIKGMEFEVIQRCSFVHNLN